MGVWKSAEDPSLCSVSHRYHLLYMQSLSGGASGTKWNWRAYLQGKYQRRVNKEMLSLVAGSGSCLPLTTWSLKRLVAAKHLSHHFASSLTSDLFTRTATGCFLTPTEVTQPCFQLGSAVLSRAPSRSTLPKPLFQLNGKSFWTVFCSSWFCFKELNYMCVFLEAHKAYSVTTLCWMQTFVVLFCVHVGQLAKFVIAI